MIRGENSVSIPMDLIIEILSRLPAKTIARFSCVSRLWRSMFNTLYFTELFQITSSARPRLLFAVAYDKQCCLFSSPHPQNPYEKPSCLVVTADFHMKLHGCLGFGGHASGLVYYDRCMGMMICNPSTGKYAHLPEQPDQECSTKVDSRSFLGFDPIDKQFKVLSITSLFRREKVYRILTLGTGDDSWRTIHCPLNHVPSCHLPEGGICIDGVLYYIAEKTDDDDHMPYMIVCFHVRSQKFKFIYKEFIRDQHTTNLINYKGKLGLITLRRRKVYKGRNRSLKLCLWVINDESESCLEYSYTFWKNDPFVGCNDVSTIWESQMAGCNNILVVGVTAKGEIVLSMNDASKSLYVFYLNIKSNALQKVEIRGFGPPIHEAFGKRRRVVIVSVDHIEDLKFIST